MTNHVGGHFAQVKQMVLVFLAKQKKNNFISLHALRNNAMRFYVHINKFKKRNAKINEIINN